MDDDTLKCEGQYSKLIYMLAMLTKFFKHILSLTITLRCFQDILFGPDVDKLLYLVITLLNSSLEKWAHAIIGLVRISFNMLKLVYWL